MLGARLKKLRSKQGLSQEELSKILGLTRGTYAHYEINKRQPDYDTLKKIADFFDVTLDYLITGNEKNISSDEMWQEFLNPKTQIFFKDLQNAPEEKIEELIRFWEFIKERDKSK
ncbi:helix-turn-helix domain-containing protein [Peribacillus frigoritolerans]|uniref:helix-turn-helix domain-containing protein n=1 Tax=Peribacillus frigoritolerans TaxID=450367 RepID=UPI0032E3A7C6